MEETVQIAGTELCMSSAYHPQSDGQTEMVNQCIKGYLRCSIHSCPSAWSLWLHLAEYWYNTSYHSALKLTPFEVLYTQTPRHFGIDPDQDVVVPELDTWIQSRQTANALLQQ